MSLVFEIVKLGQPVTFFRDEMLVTLRTASMFFPHIIGDNSPRFAYDGPPQNRPS